MSQITPWKRLSQRTGWPFGPIFTLLVVFAIGALLWAAPHIRDYLEGVL